jgi:hypothetical protein
MVRKRRRRKRKRRKRPPQRREPPKANQVEVRSYLDVSSSLI